jgi:sugar/nucleoside kinase (ribokinase family)
MNKADTKPTMRMEMNQTKQDIFVVNQTEAELITGIASSDDDLEWTKAAGRFLLEKGVGTAIITVGK